MSARERYENDVMYHQLVDMMLSMIYKCEFTPSEMREAAMLASIKYEETQIRQHMLNITPEMHNQLICFRSLVDGSMNSPIRSPDNQP